MISKIRDDLTFARGAMRTLKRIRSIHSEPGRTFVDVFEEVVRRNPDRVALTFEGADTTYSELNVRANRYAWWARSQGVGVGDVVALLMNNSSEYIAIWLGVLKVGGSVALLNTSLVEKNLAHCINLSGASIAVVGADLAEKYEEANHRAKEPGSIWVVGDENTEFHSLDEELLDAPPGDLPREIRSELTVERDAFYIYTSGTTGRPKAARITHARVLGIVGAFSGGPGVTKHDRMYVCLPLYHSMGGIAAVGAVLSVGGTAIIARKFSVESFWEDVASSKATLFQYIGELCRYLLNGKYSEWERRHRLRYIIGNGLRPDVWSAFQERFEIPRIIELYGSTEGNVSLMNFDGKVGAIGRIPNWAKSRYNVELVKFDIENEVPLRNEDGRCLICAPGEVGEAIGEIKDDPAKPTARFDGYSDYHETEKKILRNVFKEGDAWFRSGDLLRCDERGYFFFVDRIGDTFRWKGENVATSDVSEALSSFHGIDDVNAYGVPVPGADGKAGMASIVSADLDLVALYNYLDKTLPAYARPQFIRVQKELEVTETFKHKKNTLVKLGFDPSAPLGVVYYRDKTIGAYRELDGDVYQEIMEQRHQF